ncbi:hypothetical protein GCM10010123_07960 [Pilimelia anulata]|uniref:histidine kinase n=1 Tax=Pilimelia anulata TaxID=53371 RepID=A0A8J3B4L4_9ACTN|nr:ATP-binding protein [Pilimelia anulata]GGJ80433.1 hypothetical protein GCM10010123_07960 [Pilimelia anulata]
MSHVDRRLLAEPTRLAAVDRTRRVLCGMALPTDAVAGLAAKLLAAPMGVVCLVRDDEDLVVGAHGLPDRFADRHLDLRYAVGQYVLGDGPVTVVEDVDEDPDLRRHGLVRECGVRAFLGVPLADPDGRPVGALVVLDRVVRRWSNADISALLEIGTMLVPADRPPAAVRGSSLPDVELGPLLESTAEAFVAADVDGTVVGWNLAAADLFGLPVAEALGRRLADLFVADGAARLGDPAVHRQRVQGVGRHRDGREFPVEAFLNRVPSPAGPLLCGFLLDITERVTLRRAALRHARFVEALLDSLLTGVAACDPDGRVIVANRSLRDWYAIPEDWQPFSLLDNPAVATALDGTELAVADLPLIRAWRGEVVRDELLRIPPPGGGASRAVLVNANPVTDPEGRPLGAVAALHDMTAQLRHETFRDRQLEVVEALAYTDDATTALRAVLRAIAGALGWRRGEAWLCDPVTDSVRPAAAWTPAAGTGAADDGAAGTAWLGRALAAECCAARAPVRRNSAAERALAVPIREENAVLGVLTLLTPSGDPPDDVAVAFAEAMCSHVAGFLARRRAAALRTELGRSKDDFIALVGHAVRTPLTSIGSYAELLLADAQRWTGDEREMLTAIARNAENLRAIIGGLLDLAALESGHAELAAVPVDLAIIVRDEVGALAEVAAHSDVLLRDRLPDALPVVGDPGRLRLLVHNLLSNAVKYSPDGGTVEILARAEPPGVVELTILDGGVGIPPDERDRLFRRFFRASTAVERGIPGAGLGLSMSRAIIEAHGGTLALTSREPAARGTAATVRLPHRRP